MVKFWDRSATMALVWCGGQTRGEEVVWFDSRLREAALREDFGVLPLR